MATQAIVALTFVYIVLVSRDLDLGGVPLKLVLVAATLLIWYASSGHDRRLFAFPMARPVLVFGVLAPAIWILVAIVTQKVGSSSATIGSRDAFEEASRFAYLLLYFPLADLLGGRECRWRIGLVVVPALVIAATTCVLWLELRFGDPGWRDATQVLTYGGVFGVQEGVARIFFGNQIFLLPALGFVLASHLTGSPARLTIPAATLLVSAIFLAHARGLWIAVLVGLSPLVLLGSPRVSLALARRALPAVVVALAIMSIGSVVVLDSRPGFLQDASSGQRVSQASHLIDAWRTSPIYGSGMGAALSDGFARSAGSPWSFELTYLQLLFQMGVLGLLVVLWPLAAASVTGARKIAAFHCELRADGSDESMPAAVIAGLAAVVGVYIATATNPFLLSSFGMTAAALGLALVSGKPPTRPELARQGLTTRALAGSAQSPRAHFAVVPVRSRQRWLGGLSVLILCALLALVEFGGPRVGGAGNDTGVGLAITPPDEDAPKAPAGVRGVARVPTATDWATDGDLGRSDEPLYGINARSGSITARATVFGGPQLRRRTLRARLTGANGVTHYDVTRWARDQEDPDLVVVNSAGGVVRTRVVALDGTSKVRASGTVRLPLARPGTFRAFSVVRTAGSNTRPDVIVFERILHHPSLTVTVVDGASRYGAVSQRFVSSLPAASQRSWQVDAAATLPRTSKAGTVSRSLAAMFYTVNEPGRHFEVHPASALDRFASFTSERRTQLTGDLGADAVALTGQIDGQPTAYVVRPGRRTARVDLVRTGLGRR